ncbi:WD repeat protein [Calothrix sp. NIES-4071]|nr:WD repeat protein [Calothrix sp. NIES-4071]BAZ59203.1 WD repeat protein [Calothrix sp. NIES-4105]
MSNNPEQPREFDAVLGGQVAPPTDSVVLGGIEGVKSRLNSPVEEVQLLALHEAFKYGEEGFDIINQSLIHKSTRIKWAAYELLKNKLEAKVKEELKNYRYHFFTCIRTLEGHISKIYSICLSLDGLTLYSGSEDNNINAWDWQAGEYTCICKSQPMQYTPTVSCLQLSPDGQEIVIAYRGESIETRSLMNARRIIVQNSGLYHSFVISQDGKTIFTDDGKKREIVAYDFRSGKVKYSLPERLRSISALAISLDGKTLFSSNSDYTIKIWDLKTAKPIRILSNAHTFTVTALCLSPDGNILFSASSDNTIRIWNCRQELLNSSLTGHSGGVNSIALSPDGQTLFTASNDKTIKIWNWQTGELINTLEGHLGNVSSIAISPNGDYLFSASHDNTIKVWGLE